MKAVFFMVSLALPFSLAAADATRNGMPILATHTSTPLFLPTPAWPVPKSALTTPTVLCWVRQ